MLLALGAAGAHAADFKPDARVWVGAGIDSNPSRDFTSPGNSTPYDAFGAAVASVSGALSGDWGRIYASYEFGGRKFFVYPSQDTEVQSATLDGSTALGKYLALGADLRARDRRGAERDYSDLVGEAYLDFVPDNAVSVRARGGAHRFLYWNRFEASFWGPTFGGSAQYRFNKHHQVFLFGDVELHTHNANANTCVRADDGSCATERPDERLVVERVALRGPHRQLEEPSDPPPPMPPVRSDTFFSVGVGYTYRGPFQLTVQYSYLDLTSNSFGETYRRHRFSGTAGFRLPLDFTLLGAAAVQIAQYPDGVCLSSCAIRLEDDAENSSNVSVKIVHPLGPHFDFDLKYAIYYNRLPRNDLSYLRMVGSLGLGWRW